MGAFEVFWTRAYGTIIGLHSYHISIQCFSVFKVFLKYMISFDMYFSKGFDCTLNYTQGCVLLIPVHTRNMKIDGIFSGEAGISVLNSEAEWFFFFLSFSWWGEHVSWEAKFEKVNLSLKHWVSWKPHGCEPLSWRVISVWNQICIHYVSLCQLSSDEWGAYLNQLGIVGGLLSSSWWKGD